MEPLPPGDERYVDVEASRSSNPLQRMRVRLEDYLSGREEGRFAKVALTGHRGTGKTTELFRLEERLSDRAFPIHLRLDETLRENFDYTLMLLWLAESLAHAFDEMDFSLDSRFIDDIAQWFAAITETSEEILKASVEVGAGVEAKAGAGLFGLGLKLFAGLKSRIVGNTEERIRIQRTLQNYSTDLISRTNDLLLHAQQVLDKKAGGRKLLIVQDELDRLPRDPAARLFIDHGDLLHALRAHFIFTVPLGLTLAPHRIDRVFPDYFSLPMPMVENREGEPFEPGIGSLTALLAKRVDLKTVFANDDAVRELVRASGGSFRDLMRMLSEARLSALADEGDHLTADHVAQAIRTLRLDFERILVPARTYFSLLAKVDETKRDPFDGGGGAEQAAQDREFFRELIANGAVLEHNGHEIWFDVHPALRLSPQLQAARNAA